MSSEFCVAGETFDKWSEAQKLVESLQSQMPRGIPLFCKPLSIAFLSVRVSVAVSVLVARLSSAHPTARFKGGVLKQAARRCHCTQPLSLTVHASLLNCRACAKRPSCLVQQVTCRLCDCAGAKSKKRQSQSEDAKARKKAAKAVTRAACAAEADPQPSALPSAEAEPPAAGSDAEHQHQSKKAAPPAKRGRKKHAADASKQPEPSSQQAAAQITSMAKQMETVVEEEAGPARKGTRQVWTQLSSYPAPIPADSSHRGSWN